MEECFGVVEHHYVRIVRSSGRGLIKYERPLHEGPFGGDKPRWLSLSFSTLLLLMV